MSTRSDKERDANRSRAAILDAAERLFADQGYDATSLSQVGAAAGVSRATPGYFFGSKSDLYQAVLDRCFAEVRAAVRAGRVRAMASSLSRSRLRARRGASQRSSSHSASCNTRLTTYIGDLRRIL